MKAKDSQSVVTIVKSPKELGRIAVPNFGNMFTTLLFPTLRRSITCRDCMRIKLK